MKVPITFSFGIPLKYFLIGYGGAATIMSDSESEELISDTQQDNKITNYLRYILYLTRQQGYKLLTIYFVSGFFFLARFLLGFG